MRQDYRKDFPAGMAALVELEAAIEQTSLSPALLEIVRIRVSQINGCAYCLAMHNRVARELGEQPARLDTIGAWHDSPFFSAKERASLAWAEALTLLSTHGAPDEVYLPLKDHFTDEEITALTYAIAATNVWNRLAVGLH